MGCVCSRRRSRRTRSDPLCPIDSSSIACERRSSYKSCDSGDLRTAAGKAGAPKVPEASSIFERAGHAGLERAVEVLDSLGSSMTSLNPSSGFASVTARGNKMSILAFEVANTIAKGANLLMSLSEENIQFLKEEILESDGVGQLVSVDIRELMSIAAADKREELDVFSVEVIRFGDLCKDPVWHNLGRYFQKLDADLTPQDQRKEEVDTTMQQLINLAKNTSELYHELHALDRFEHDYHLKIREEDSLPTARRESLMIVHSELKRQRKHVKSLKKKSLWSRNLEEVVERLVDIVVFLHKRILDSFGLTGTNFVDNEMVNERKLGASGLALHYANIIIKIDNIVSRPLSLPPNTRDTLYHGLPTGVKAALRSRLQLFDAKEEYTVAQIKAQMEKTLRWIVPLAENTIKAHQGFGWVGEWANISTEVNNKPAPGYNVSRIQTLHYADKEKTEKYILELVVWLHQLVIQVKNQGFGFKALKPVRTMSQRGTQQLQETKRHPSPEFNGHHGIVLKLSQEESEILECVSSVKVMLGRSKSQKADTRKERRWQKSLGPSRSCGNSPTREFGVALKLNHGNSNVMDVMDGLDTLEIFPRVQFLG